MRQSLLSSPITREEALKSLDLDPTKKTILLVGGSLGARTINESVLSHLKEIAESDLQFIWQTGKYYHEEMEQRLKEYNSQLSTLNSQLSTLNSQLSNLKPQAFIADMAAAYRAADLVVSRAGASSISEFCLIGKPVILVPSPNVAEDHQTKNALALANRDAALYVKDSEAQEKLIPLAMQTVADDARLKNLSENVLKMALPDSARIIAEEVLKLAIAV